MNAETALNSAIVRLRRAEDTVYYLRMALAEATQAQAPRTTDRIRKALKSAEGAVRHAQGRRTRAESVLKEAR